MNLRLVSKYLGILALLVGAFMLLSLPWAIPGLGHRTGELPVRGHFETRGFFALLVSGALSGLVGGLLYWPMRRVEAKLYRKEAMAIVGLGWILATVLGAFPYWLSGTGRGPSVRLFGPEHGVQVWRFGRHLRSGWQTTEPLTSEEYRVVAVISSSAAGARGLPAHELRRQSAVDNAVELFLQLQAEPVWSGVLIAPGDPRDPAPADRAGNYRIRWVRMGPLDCLFESQSGFSTTGATVIGDLEDSHLVPHSILFWRASTQFLGGLGIIVLFVAILGHGAVGKVLLQAERPSDQAVLARVQHTAWAFAGIYCGLNGVLILVFMATGLNFYDAICHAFCTVSTGGFSTYNASVGHFNSVTIELVFILFMILGATNFTLLYWVLLRQPGKLLASVEWRTFVGIVAAVIVLMAAFGIAHSDPGFQTVGQSLRHSAFHVVSIITTSGFSTADWDQWNEFSRGMFLALMFVGGCTGSTSGSLKVMRHVLMARVLSIEIERAYHPRVVRLLKVGNDATEDQDVRRNLLVYFALIAALFALGWLFLLTFEPNSTWGPTAENKLIDSAACISSMINNIGPALGTAGPAQNYGHFSGLAKLVFLWLMMLGRLEIFPILVLFIPRFWRDP